ncbi:transcriptional regulator [Alteromonadaceae bacterium M269]|nr:transcriptional regulator [Alteromonadaceae bacterium M269]
MAARSYSQSCSMAIFLDHLGERWSLLLVRELMLGPRRFKQLLEGLRGIGPNLLTQRLSQLQEMGVVRKADEENPNSYVLTDAGKELEPILLAMARWSLKNIPSDDVQGRLNRDELLVIAFRACFRPPSGNQLNEEYEFRIGQTNFVLVIKQESVTSYLGQSNDPAFIFIATSDTFNRLVKGEIDMETAETTKALKIIGEREAFERWQAMFSLDAYSI